MAYRDGEEVWYPEGDISFIPDEEDIIGLDFYVDGELKNHFRLVSDGSSPYELELWDDNNACYLSCAVAYTFNIWERMITSKKISQTASRMATKSSM